MVMGKDVRKTTNEMYWCTREKSTFAVVFQDMVPFSLVVVVLISVSKLTQIVKTNKTTFGTSIGKSVGKIYEG